MIDMLVGTRLPRICYEHIALNEDGVPTIASTTMKVVELVVEQQAYGWSPEDCISSILIDRADPLGLAYYWDHRDEWP